MLPNFEVKRTIGALTYDEPIVDDEPIVELHENKLRIGCLDYLEESEKTTLSRTEVEGLVDYLQDWLELDASRPVLPKGELLYTEDFDLRGESA